MKKLLHMLLALALVLGLSACGGGENGAPPLYYPGHVEKIDEAGAFDPDLYDMEELDADTAFMLYKLGDYGLTREDVKAVYVPCDEIAAELGNGKVANMVMLGAYVAATGALKQETIETMIREMFTGKKAKLVPLNLEALKRGMACGKPA